jgi:hypothetical protein
MIKQRERVRKRGVGGWECYNIDSVDTGVVLFFQGDSMQHSTASVSASVFDVLS